MDITDLLHQAADSTGDFDRKALKELRSLITPERIMSELSRAILDHGDNCRSMQINISAGYGYYICNNPHFKGTTPAVRGFLDAIEKNWWVESARITRQSRCNYLELKFTKDFTKKIAAMHTGQAVSISDPAENLPTTPAENVADEKPSLISRIADFLSLPFRRTDASVVPTLPNKTSARSLGDHLTSSLKSVTRSVAIMSIDAEPLRLAVQKAMDILEKDTEGKAHRLYNAPKHDMALLAQEYAHRADIVDLGKPMSPEETKSVADSLNVLSITFKTANDKALTMLSDRALIGVEVATTSIQMRIQPPNSREPV